MKVAAPASAHSGVEASVVVEVRACTVRQGWAFVAALGQASHSPDLRLLEERQNSSPVLAATGRHWHQQLLLSAIDLVL